MAKRDFYDVLGVSKSALPDDIKKAYRKLAKQYHPDVNRGNKEKEKKFKEISEAYDVLKDEKTKKAYDQYGHDAFSSARGAGQPPGGGFQGFSSMSDIFEDLFGGGFSDMGMGSQTRGGSAGNAQAKGHDLRYDLEMTLEEAYRGKDVEVRLRVMVLCSECHGTGAEAGAQPTNCMQCHGTGRIRSTQAFFTVEQTCPVCMGNGKRIEKPCKKCRMQGIQASEENISFHVPNGIDTETRLRVNGKGDAGPRGASRGDLYVFVRIKKHKLFEREKKNLLCTVPISMTMAALGGSITAPVIDGTNVQVSVPSGTQNGDRLRLRGKGMPSINSNTRGDCYLRLDVEIPVKLTVKQKGFLEEFQKESHDKATPKSTGFFAKVKDFLDSWKS